MHHGGGPPNSQRQLQRSKSTTNSEAEEQQQQALAVTQQQQVATNHPQSLVTSFTSATTAASPSAPQSPNYQIIMSRSPVTGQNMNITLQNVGQMMTAAGNQQITLTSLPLQNPASPGFQHQTSQWTSSYIQVTSPLPQTLQPQSPTPHSWKNSASLPAVDLGLSGHRSRSRFRKGRGGGEWEADPYPHQTPLTSPTGGGGCVWPRSGWGP